LALQDATKDDAECNDDEPKKTDLTSAAVRQQGAGLLAAGKARIAEARGR
jgi:hypothetical protein